MPTQIPLAHFGAIRVKTPPVGSGQRIGIMGGSFNPPHEGHAIVGATALKRLRLDRVWWLVTPGNPLKSHGDLAPLAKRIAASQGFLSNPRMTVTAFERELETRFTAQTLGFLKQRYPSATFVWVMGADNLASFHRWQHWRSIAAALPIAVVDRPGWRFKALSSPAAQALSRQRLPEARAARLTGRPRPRWTLLSTRLSHASSTKLRSKLK